MIKKPRILLASFLAPLAVLFTPATVAVVTLFSDPADDAPIKASGILLYAVIPLVYPFITALMATTGYSLSAINKLSLRNLLIGSGLISVAAGLMFGMASPFGTKDRLIGLAIFGITTMFCFSGGTFFWWYLAYRKDSRTKQ